MSKYSNILIPIDFSEASKVAIRKALDQAVSADDITLVHIVDYMPPAYVRPEIPEKYVSKNLMTQHAREHLNELIKETGLDGCQSIVEFGQAKTHILSLLKQRQIDLVVLAKHSRSRIERLLGSVSNAVAHEAECDVLIVHE